MRWPYRPHPARLPHAPSAAGRPAAFVALATLTACGSLAANRPGAQRWRRGRRLGTAARNGGLCASRGGLTSLLVKRVGVLPLLRQEQSRVRAHSKVAAVRAEEGRRRDLRAAPGPPWRPDLPGQHRHHLQAVLHRRVPALPHGRRAGDRLPAGDRGGQAAHRRGPSRLLGRAGQGRPAAAAPPAGEPRPSRAGHATPPHGPTPPANCPGPRARSARGAGPRRCFPDER